MPKTHDAYFDFFQTVQDKLRAKGRRIYGLGYSMATKEADAGTLFHHFLVAYGGKDIVLPSGKLNIDDAAVQKAAVTALERLTTPYKKGYVPPGRDKLGRRRQQQRLLRQADRDDAKRDDLDRGRADGEGRSVLQADHHPGHPARQRRQARSGHTCRGAVPDPEGRQEHRRRQGLVEELHQAGQSQPVSEGDARPLPPGDDVEHQVGPLLAGPRRPAPATSRSTPASSSPPSPGG